MEAKMVKPSRRKYDADFKKEVIKMIESGRSVSDVAQSLGIGNNLVYQWLRHSKTRVPSSESSAVISFDTEKPALYKRIRDLEMERDI